MTHPFELRRRDILLAALSVLGGCGGVDSGGTGTGASSTFASGPITGFGSIIVNGVRFDDTTASVQDDDGQMRSQADLRLGMRAEILASAVSTAGGVSSATASSIRIQREIVGPLESVDLANGRLTVLGQVVAVVPSTVLDSAITGGIGSLAIGELLEVYGVLDLAAGRYVASRIDRRATATSYTLRGAVGTLSVPARTLSIGQLTIDWAGIAVADPATSLAPGRIVRVSLDVTPIGGIWRAIAIASGQAMPEDRDAAEVEGRITAFTSASSFDLDALPVDARGALFPDGTAALGLGARIEVHGSLRNGVLIASKVEIEGEEEGGTAAFELHGSITAVDVAASSFVVRGVTVVWDAGTQFDSSSASDIRIGRSVEVHGRLAADGQSVTATAVHVAL